MKAPAQRAYFNIWCLDKCHFGNCTFCDRYTISFMAGNAFPDSFFASTSRNFFHQTLFFIRKVMNIKDSKSCRKEERRGYYERDYTNIFAFLHWAGRIKMLVNRRRKYEDWQFDAFWWTPKCFQKARTSFTKAFLKSSTESRNYSLLWSSQLHLRQKSNGKVSQATTKKQVCCFCNAEEIPFMCSLRKHKALTIGSWRDFMQKVLFFLSLLRRKLAFLQSHCYLVFNSFSPVCDGACCEEASPGECLQPSLRWWIEILIRSIFRYQKIDFPGAMRRHFSTRSL